MIKKRILYISSIVPDTSCGAHMAIYRHFVHKDDFDVTVCGFVSDTALTHNKFTIVRYKILNRFFNSRFSRAAYNLEYIINWFRLPPGLLRYAREFKPDAIMTVPDNMHSGLAFMLAKKMNIPLVANFQDLFPISRFIPGFMEPYKWVRKFLLGRFFRLHEKCDLAFYTSEGMKEFFGLHPNGHVLYPVGDFQITEVRRVNDFKSSQKPVRVLYAGNCYGAYGRMLLQFAREIKNTDAIKLKIFPVGKGWADADIEEMTEAGIYQNFLPFEELKKEFEATDAFLTVMSFEEGEKPFVKTSFTTKWLDYAPFGKPIFVWGPEYCSAVVFAKKFESGIFVVEDEAVQLKQTIIDVASQQALWERYSGNAKKVSEKVLNPNGIHSLLVGQINKIADLKLQNWA